MEDGYQFDDVGDTTEPVVASSPEPRESQPRGGSGGNGSYADEIYSKKINAKFRTFFIDLKQSSNGKFLKISEKSHGRKSTVMMDAEDIPTLIEALQEMQAHL